jgi:hypothetical protein
MGMVIGLVEANPFDSLRFSRLLRVWTDESKAAGRGSEAKPPRIKGIYQPKSKRHAHSKMPVRIELTKKIHYSLGLQPPGLEPGEENS